MIKNKPDFLIIGAQKCGTTWLWNILQQHPGTDLNLDKEIHFFSSSKSYRKGVEWYYAHFKRLDTNKVIGEASTDYFYDYVLIDNLEIDHSLPLIPELVTKELPEINIFVMLRDPVRRAISAYYHHITKRRYSPYLRIKDVVQNYPRLRIIERGHYAQYLKLWKEFIPQQRLRCYILEDDIANKINQTINDAYGFLSLDRDFFPRNPRSARNKEWGWTHIVIQHYVGSLYGRSYRFMMKTPFSKLLDKVDFIERPKIGKDDIEFLREIYLPEKAELERILGRDLDFWDYGSKLVD